MRRAHQFLVGNGRAAAAAASGARASPSPIQSHSNWYQLHHASSYTSGSSNGNNDGQRSRWFPLSSSVAGRYGGGIFAGAVSFSAMAAEVYAKEPPPLNLRPKEVVLYQYEACPFCNKVKAFLDYYDIPYTVVEVNPISKKEIKWSEYKKVPILTVDGENLVDSSDIINKMNHKIHPTDSVPEENSEETEWRRWVDNHLVHMLSPNIYRNASEALESFDYITSHALWWESYGSHCPELQKLAIRILSLTCSATGCERNWSIFDQIHTKRRNKLEQERLNALVYVKYNLQLEIRHNQRKDNYGLDPICLSDLDSDDEWITEREDPTLPLDTTWMDVNNDCFKTQCEEGGSSKQKKKKRGNFSFYERVTAKYAGAAAMYFVSKKLKKRHNITDERASLYEAAETWVNALDGRDFLGGSKPNLADLAVFGVLRPIRYLRSGKDMVENTRIGDWYTRMEEVVGEPARINTLKKE